jgi:hypothetical protein
MAKIVELIYTTSTKGKGVPEDPVRSVAELWTKNGTLVATIDNWSKESWVNDPSVWAEEK